MSEPEEWERLLAAERRLQALVPGAVLVGGTAVALHLRHRISIDGDHVLADLRDRFDAVLAQLEASPGWATERLQRPVLILGRLEGVMTGLRQLRRERALESEVCEGLRVATLVELARIKCWLLVDRNAVRDYLDAVAILESLGEARVREALRDFDSIYSRAPSGSLPSVALVERLQAAQSVDRDRVDLAAYKGIRPPWNDWNHLQELGRQWSARLAKWTMSP
jgi:hypothetical protein